MCPAGIPQSIQRLIRGAQDWRANKGDWVDHIYIHGTLLSAYTGIAIIEYSKTHKTPWARNAATNIPNLRNLPLLREPRIATNHLA